MSELLSYIILLIKIVLLQDRHICPKTYDHYSKQIFKIV